MTRRPSQRPKLARKDTALRDGIGLRHITPNTAKTVERDRKEAVRPAPIISSHALRSARLLLPLASNSTADVRTRALSP